MSETADSLVSMFDYRPHDEPGSERYVDEDAFWHGGTAAQGVDPAMNHDAAMAELEATTYHARVAFAEQYRVIAQVVREAEEQPDIWVGADPTLDPAWLDARGRSSATVRRDRIDVAVRAAIADMAVRLRLAEATVRTRAAYAETLRRRCPRVWAGFLGGLVPEPNAIAAARLADSLPSDALEAWALFDELIVRPAERLAPARFRTAARAIRERVHAEPLEARHARAVADRGVWLTPELDGMTTLTALLPAASAQGLMARVDAVARHLRSADDEARTLAQLRADVLGDLAPGDTSDAPLPRVAVSVTVPALSLMGESAEPATLDGYGPIDLETAKRFAGSASSWTRILTHPVTGTVLDVDRAVYRVPADLRRRLAAAYPTCAFPGCGRSSAGCDLDHTVAWQDGGTTSIGNLAPLCRPHHRLKHESLWEVDRAAGALSWTSPSGNVSAADPPPF